MKALNFVVLRAPLQSLALAFGELPAKLNPMFVDGLRLATPVFYKELQKSEVTNKKEQKKIQDSIYKYWLRSCTRCTPYGFFAGSTIINIADNSSIVLAGIGSGILKARLDMGYLTLLKAEIEKLENIQSQIKFKVNNSLYETARDYRYIEYFLNENIRDYKLSSVEKTEYLKFIFTCAKQYITLDELVKKLVDFSNVKFEEAQEFIIEMINSQLLISELELTLTGSDPLRNLISKLQKLPGTNIVVGKLKQIDTLLNNLNKYKYEHLEQQLLEVFNLKGTYKDIVQIDLSLSTVENTISKKLIDEIVSQVNDLQSLSRLASNANIENFKSKFIERYESAEVPLSIVLDNDLGIGYGGDEKSENNEWIQTIPTIYRSAEGSFRHDFITKYTYSKYQDFIINQRTEIEITVEEITELPKSQYKFASSSYLFGSLLGDLKPEDNNFSFHLNGFSSSPAATILGRFTLGDDELTKLTKSTLQNEEAEYPNAIFAEIIHVPQARAGNLLLRSSLRDYEIPYLGQSGVEEEFQIPVNDLVVCVKNNEVILRSIKNNKRVFPRLSSAQNFHFDSLPVYKFLCDIQFQGLAQPCIWDWGIFKEEKYLPRVRYKNIILQKARWRITENDIKECSKSVETESYETSIAVIRKQRGLPKLVTLIQGDNNLLIDLENQKAVLLLIDFIKKHKTLVIEEFLFTNENCIVKDKNGLPYTNEVIIPVVRDYGTPTSFENVIEPSSIQRKFPPSSEWLYFKIYGGGKTLEKILLTSIYPFLEKNKSCFEKFFFIRYTDPGVHLRLRFFNSNFQTQVNLQKEFMEILKPHVDSGQLEKVIIDTYVRELERYSEELIVESESIFHNDSLSILRLNKLLDEVEDASKYRIIFAMRGIDALFSDFNLDLERKRELSKNMSASFMNEFGGGTGLRKIINDKYRKVQKEIASNMDELQDQKNELEEAIDIFKIRSQHNEHIVNEIVIKLKGRDKLRMDNLLRDYIHMFINRLFITHQRKYELVIYSFLERYYSSQYAIVHKSKKSNSFQ